MVHARDYSIEIGDGRIDAGRSADIEHWQYRVFLPKMYNHLRTSAPGFWALIRQRSGWHEIVDYVLEETDADLWITEIGINHPPMNKSLKAERIVSYIDQLPGDRVRGVAIFTLARGSDWPQYEYVESMVPVFADRGQCRFFVATEQWLCSGFKSYWEQYGGLPVFGYPIS